MLAALVRKLGPDHWELAEESVQEALLKALQTWPYRGVPDDPAGWLYRVACNAALDRVRRNARLASLLPLLDRPEGSVEADLDPGVIADDELRMMFTCCHPDLTPAMQVSLTLMAVGGFSVGEIARAFLAQKPAVAQRLVRAKRLLRERGAVLEMPEPAELPARAESVLRVLYLMFNEGYSACGGDVLVRRDLCREAIRLARIVAAHPAIGTPEAHALLALMLLQGSRIEARVDPAGAIALLADQDRARWDRGMIAEGLRHLDAAAAGEELSGYHLEASIAACHALAPTAGETDWNRLLHLYDLLAERGGSPVALLSRAVVIAMVEGPAAAISAVRLIADHPALREYHGLHSVLGELHARSGDPAAAASAWAEALRFVRTQPEREFVERQLRLYIQE